MSKLVALLVILLPTILVAQANSSGRSRPIVFLHASVIDMTGAQPKPDMTIVIESGRIVEIGKTGRVKVPASAQIVDATGKFLIPGLWDMHAHSTGAQITREIFFPLEIANGVTGVRDMFSDCNPNCSFNNGSLDDGISLEEIAEWRRQSAAGTLVAPRIIASSPLLDGPGARWKGSLIVKHPDEVRGAVLHIKERGADFLKIYSRLSHDTYFAIIDEAKRQNIIFAGHVPDSITAVEASDAGQKSVEHLTGVLLAASTDETNLRSETLAWRKGEANMSRKEIDERTLATYDEAKANALFTRFVRNGTWMCPTLTLLRAGAFLDDKSFTNDVRLGYLPSSFREDWRPENDPRFKDLTAADFVFKRKRFEKQLEIVGAMNRAGVMMLAGTDTPNPYCFPGFSLHDELALFVKAGLSTFDALKTATSNPAKFLRREKDLGTIEKGKLADLVLLDGNPLVDITNTRKINAVVANGRLLSREVLDVMLSAVKAKSR